MSDKESFDWGVDESEFPSSDVAAWEFYTKPSNEEGDTETLQCRMDPEIGRRMDEAIQLAKEKGVHLKTRSDFFRWALYRSLDHFVSYLKINDETLTHWLVLEKEAMKIAYRSAMFARVRESVRDLQIGLDFLTDPQRGDWTEARDRITSWLVPVMQLAGDQDFLMKLYVRELFGSKAFQTVLERVGGNVRLGSVIDNARKGYEKITREAGG